MRAEVVAIEGFELGAPKRYLGAPYEQYEADGARLLVSVDGIQKLQEQPTLANIVGRVGAHIARQGTLDPMMFPEEQDSLPLHQYSQGDESTVYETTGIKPPVIFKQYNQSGGDLSFHAMQFLHQTFKETNKKASQPTAPPFNVPEQYALIMSHAGLATIVMEKLPSGVGPLGAEGPGEIIGARIRLVKILGLASILLTNDLGANLLVEHRAPDIAGNVRQSQYWLIDQPSTHVEHKRKEAYVALQTMRLTRGIKKILHI